MINNNSHSFGAWKEFLVLLIGGLVVVGAFVMYAKYDQKKLTPLNNTISPNNVTKIAKPAPVTSVIAQTVKTETYVLKWIDAQRSRDYEIDRINVTFELQNTDSINTLALESYSDFVLHTANNTWYYADSLKSGNNEIISYPKIFTGQTLRGTLDFQLPKDVAIANISYLDHTTNINIPTLLIKD